MELESWDAWLLDNKTHTASVASRHGNRFQSKKPTDLELEPEVDYFQEMQLEPSIRKTKKVKMTDLTTVPYDD